MGEFSKIFRSTTRNKFLNGDRFIYMKLNPNVVPPIAHRIQISEYYCRVQYSSMNQICERCKRHGHKTSDTKKCEAFEPSQENVHYITNGILSNFGECNVKFEDIDFISSEHAYQWNPSEHAYQWNPSEHAYQWNPSEHAYQWNPSEHAYQWTGTPVLNNYEMIWLRMSSNLILHAKPKKSPQQ